MKRINENKLDEILSLYLDNSLSEFEKNNIELLIKTDVNVAKRLAQLSNLRDLLMAKRKIEPNIGFWTQLSQRIEDTRREESNYLPFSRKYISAIAILTSMIIVVLGTLVIQNRELVFSYISEKSQVVKEAYKNNFLQDSLLPLFSKVDKDKALQFSLFGTLPLDDKSETTLKIDEKSEKGYRVEVGKAKKKNLKPVTFENFIAEVKPTNMQKKIIDSLLDLTGRRIESSVLIGENNTMAIAPDLPSLNKIMLTNIASCLEPNQRVRFEKLLETHDAPYAVINKNVLKKNTLQNISNRPVDNQYVIITPDTLIYSRIQLNIDSLRKQIEENISKIELRREAMLKRMISKEFRNVGREPYFPEHFSPSEEDRFISVEIITPSLGVENRQIFEIIRPRVRKQIANQDRQNQIVRTQILKDTNSSVDGK